MSAQERFRTVVRDRIAPGLRAMGMRGSGRLYSLPSDVCWAQFGIQRATWSDRDAVHFTANLSVVGREDWTRAHEDGPAPRTKPSPNVYSLHPFRFQERIGPVAGRTDHWWQLSADGRDEDLTCDDFLHVVGDFAVPAMLREIRSRA
ncbi:DUF4304 domain-containing protein [Myceligenerans indicum]|nr:DUF4304 domain-containing protein [Myceligenerans indicum]